MQQQMGMIPNSSTACDVKAQMFLYGHPAKFLFCCQSALITGYVPWTGQVVRVRTGASLISFVYSELFNYFN